MTFTFVIGAFVIGAFLIVPLGLVIAFALMGEAGPRVTRAHGSGPMAHGSTEETARQNGSSHAA